ncbi:MAG: acetamidase [Bacteroidia bacterium]|nr:MAG: acetamidase [Bacteroidia bacterium]
MLVLLTGIVLSGCNNLANSNQEDTVKTPEPSFTLTKDQTHNKFSSTIEPVIRVPSGAVIEVFTEDAADEQIVPGMTAEEYSMMDYDGNLVHPLTGPVYVEGAMPGDVLMVTLHKMEPGDWGWTRVVPGIFVDSEEFEPLLRTFELNKEMKTVEFSDGIAIHLEPFAGVMGVAPPDTGLLSTIPPLANGGNMDDSDITEGTIVYFPVFVEGALFSIGDMHAAQGAGEVCGTAIEIPGRIIYQVDVIRNGRKMSEPQYETDDYYAVTAFAPTLDEAARKANVYMIDYLESQHGLDRSSAYMLTSLAADLKIAEVVDRNMLVTMHLPKNIFIK